MSLTSFYKSNISYIIISFDYSNGSIKNVDKLSLSIHHNIYIYIMKMMYTCKSTTAADNWIRNANIKWAIAHPDITTIYLLIYLRKNVDHINKNSKNINMNGQDKQRKVGAACVSILLLILFNTHAEPYVLIYT